MATTMTAGAVRRGFRPSFFFWMTVAMACCIFSGFGLTYWAPMATGTLAKLPPIVHVHGLFYSAWMVLLVTQASLIGAANVAMHRTLGTFGIAIATGVLFTGALITVTVVLALQLLHAPIAHSAVFADVCGVLTNLVYYR